MTQNSNPKKMQLYCIFTLNASHKRAKHKGKYISEEDVLLKYQEL